MAALFYPIFQDWIWAMRAVSILFGSLTIIPLYFLGRLFFYRPIAFITTFVYAVLHVFVSASVDVIRDPAAWFFITMGLFTCALSLKRDKKILLCVSGIFFILATWNRFESIFFSVISLAFLVLCQKEEKGRKVIAFLAPLLTIIAAFTIYYLISQKMPNLYRLNDIVDRAKELPQNYQTIRNELTRLSLHPPPGWERFPGFFQQSRTLLWFTALGLVIQRTAEAFNYFFFFILLIGFFSWCYKWQKDRLTYWLASMAGVNLILIYLSVLRDWALEPRWISLLALPAFIFVGYGFNSLLARMEKRLPRWERKHIFFLIFVLSMAVTLPREIKLHDPDKTVFLEIGKTIALREEKRRDPINISSIGASGRLITLYSNLHIPVPSCPAPEWKAGLNSYTLPGENYRDFIETLKRINIHYFIWEEKKWPPQKYDLFKAYRPQDMEIVGTWWHRDTGKIVVFKIKETKKEKPLPLYPR
ncbi:MAG: glycosyltransferase family 39 protein, partial [Syntrophales bacterium]|nr:glycosyltransferase family 39 protein [Syntrophales bacterium]